MKYGARAIVWGHKIMKNRATIEDIPSYLEAKVKPNILRCLEDKGVPVTTPKSTKRSTRKTAPKVVEPEVEAPVE